MRILVVAATDAEIAGIAGAARGVEFLITGVGMVATAARTSRALARTRYDVALNVGVCGSLHRPRVARHPQVSMKLSLAFSPCPNDCFVFDAIVNRRIDLEGLEFTVHLGDVEELNASALSGRAEITKLSYHAYAFCADRYVVLDAGSALGRNCGPLLISRRAISNEEVARGALTIAIPGKYTTANFLLGLAFPNSLNK